MLSHMAEPKNPYEDSDQNTTGQIAIVFGCLGSVIFCFVGIWIGLGTEYGDWTPSLDRVVFAINIAAIPFMLPFIMNLIAIPFLCRGRNRQAGIVLLASSCLIALMVGIVAVRMGNF